MVGSLTLFHAPAQEDGPVPTTPLTADPLDAPQTRLPTSLSPPGPAPEGPLLFKTTLPQPEPERLPQAAAQDAAFLNAEENITPTPLAGILLLNQSDFFNKPIPPGLPQNFPSTEPPPLFGRRGDAPTIEQLRSKGPFMGSLRINTAAVYDDSLSSKSNGKKGDIQIGIGPSARLQLGSAESDLLLGASYSGSASWLMSSPKQRAYEQNIGVGGEWTTGRLKTSLRLGFESNRNGSLDAGARVGSRVSYAGGTVSCRISAKTSAELGADVTKASFNGLLESREYRTEQYLNYQYSPKLQIGLGSTQGLAEAGSSSRQTYVQGGLRAAAQPTAKLGFTAAIGNEWRHFDSGQPGTTAPVFSAGIGWQATGKTAFSVEARRRTFASVALASQNYASTNVALAVHEMLTATLDASLSLGLEDAKYSASSPGVQSNRSDQYVFSRLGLSWLIRRNCSFGTFYEWSQNDSKGDQSQPFHRNRIGVSLSVSF